MKNEETLSKQQKSNTIKTQVLKQCIPLSNFLGESKIKKSTLIKVFAYLKKNQVDIHNIAFIANDDFMNDMNNYFESITYKKRSLTSKNKTLNELKNFLDWCYNNDMIPDKSVITMRNINSINTLIKKKNKYNTLLCNIENHYTIIPTYYEKYWVDNTSSNEESLYDDLIYFKTIKGDNKSEKIDFLINDFNLVETKLTRKKAPSIVTLYRWMIKNIYYINETCEIKIDVKNLETIIKFIENEKLDEYNNAKISLLSMITTLNDNKENMNLLSLIISLNERLNVLENKEALKITKN